VSTPDAREEPIESRLEATFGVVLVMALQVTLALVRLVDLAPTWSAGGRVLRPPASHRHQPRRTPSTIGSTPFVQS
jgi:hypothetical protein